MFTHPQILQIQILSGGSPVSLQVLEGSVGHVSVQLPLYSLADGVPCSVDVADVTLVACLGNAYHEREGGEKRQSRDKAAAQRQSNNDTEAGVEDGEDRAGDSDSQSESSSVDDLDDVGDGLLFYLAGNDTLADDTQFDAATSKCNGLASGTENDPDRVGTEGWSAIGWLRSASSVVPKGVFKAVRMLASLVERWLQELHVTVKTVQIMLFLPVCGCSEGAEGKKSEGSRMGEERVCVNCQQRYPSLVLALDMLSYAPVYSNGSSSSSTSSHMASGNGGCVHSNGGTAQVKASANLQPSSDEANSFAAEPPFQYPTSSPPHSPLSASFCGCTYALLPSPNSSTLSSPPATHQQPPLSPSSSHLLSFSGLSLSLQHSQQMDARSTYQCCPDVTTPAIVNSRATAQDDMSLVLPRYHPYLPLLPQHSFPLRQL